jgi:hypothetical protein
MERLFVHNFLHASVVWMAYIFIWMLLYVILIAGTDVIFKELVNITRITA